MLRIFKRLHSTSTSPSELAHFAQLASSWWDPNGPQRILHKMNLLRLDFIRSILAKPIPNPIPGYSLDLFPESKEKSPLPTKHEWNILDVGCGGGLAAESLARLPFTKHVTAIDLSKEVLEVARSHAALDPVLTNKLDYQLCSLSDVSPESSFDVITMFEMLEHVDYPSAVLDEALSRVKPGGFLFLSTINRTPVSWFTTIFVAEHLLKIVPKGTHSYEKYIDESELRQWINKRNDSVVVQSKGCAYVPGLGWQFLGSAATGNYLMAIKKLP